MLIARVRTHAQTGEKMKKYALVMVIAVIALGAVLVYQSRSPDRALPPSTGQGPGPMGGGEGTAELPVGHPTVGTGDVGSESFDFTGIEVPSGGKNVATLYAEKSSLAGKEVVVRGKVVKFTPGVMKKNWIHLRDGTGEEGANDLTVTTNAVVSLGDVVVARGVMNIDKDFGFGYKYEIIVEDAEVTVE